MGRHFSYCSTCRECLHECCFGPACPLGHCVCLDCVGHSEARVEIDGDEYLHPSACPVCAQIDQVADTAERAMALLKEWSLLAIRLDAPNVMGEEFYDLMNRTDAELRPQRAGPVCIVPWETYLEMLKDEGQMAPDEGPNDPD